MSELVPINAAADNDSPPHNNQPQPVFHPIDLNSDEDDSVAEETPPSNPATQHIIPILEDAIQDCFSIAVNSHDATTEDISKAVWSWEPSPEKQVVEKVDPKREEEALHSWIPRPLFLPTWAVTNDS